MSYVTDVGILLNSDEFCRCRMFKCCWKFEQFTAVSVDSFKWIITGHVWIECITYYLLVTVLVVAYNFRTLFKCYKWNELNKIR